MNINLDYSKYYIGTSNLSPVAYKGGIKVEQEQKKESSLTLPKQLVKYDFGNSCKVESMDEMNEIVDAIREYHGEGVMVSINGISLNCFKMDKRERREIEERTIETETLTQEMKAEISHEVFWNEKMYGDDDKNILNHSFINDGFLHGKDFEKMASGYAKYLNNDIQTAYDEELFYDCDDEERYRKYVYEKMYQYANNALSYFMMGKETVEDVKNLSGQLVDAVMEYASNMAAGDNDIGNVKTKLSIGGTELTYDELCTIQDVLQKINMAGVTMVGTDYSKPKTDIDALYAPYEYIGMATNSDTVIFAQLGLRTAQMNYISDNLLSEETGDLVKRVWNERLENTIQVKLIDQMKRNVLPLIEERKEYINQSGNYYYSYLKGWENEEGYKGSDMEQVYNMFAGINGDDMNSFQENFSKAMDEYNVYREGKSNYGYIGSEGEKQQIDYLLATRDIIFK